MKNKVMKAAKTVFSQREVTVFLIIVLVVVVHRLFNPSFLTQTT